MTRVLVLYYSSYGHIEAMASAVAEGVREAGAEAVIKRVPETVPEAVARQFHFKLEQVAPIATADELPGYDAIIFGTPTRFGSAASQMRSFIDQTGGLWAKGALVGKVGSVFTSTATQHGGQESTILSLHTTLLHHGMVFCGLPYGEPGLTTTVAGGTPYGASHWSGQQGNRAPDAIELGLARALGRRLGRLSLALLAGRGA